MNIYVHEIKTKLKSALIWSASIAALILIFMSLYPGFSEQSAMLTEATKNFPKQLLIAFGMENMDWTTSLGFFGLIFLFCQVCIAIQAANYGFGLVSIEETEWTADFLVAKPVSRPKIMTLKLLAALTCLTITNAIVWGSSFLGLGVFASGHDYEVKNLVILLLSVVVFQMFFFSLGIAISLMVKRIRSVTPFSMALVFGLYILNVFGDMLGEKSLEMISPFKHFDANYILKNGAWNTPLVLVNVGVTIVALVAGYMLYARRNIPSAV